MISIVILKVNIYSFPKQFNRARRTLRFISLKKYCIIIAPANKYVNAGIPIQEKKDFKHSINRHIMIIPVVINMF